MLDRPRKRRPIICRVLNRFHSPGSYLEGVRRRGMEWVAHSNLAVGAKDPGKSVERTRETAAEDETAASGVVEHRLRFFVNPFWSPGGYRARVIWCAGKQQLSQSHRVTTDIVDSPAVHLG